MKIKKIIDVFFNKEFIVFIIIGVINTFNAVALSSLYSCLFNANFAFALGYSTSLLISYLLNSYFTFKETLRFIKLIKFCISYLPNFIIQFIIVFLFYNLLGFPEVFAYALAGVIGVPVTFLALKFYAFSKNK